MAYFSARARKFAWESTPDDDGASSITGGISRRSTGDSGIVSNASNDNASSHRRSRSSGFNSDRSQSHSCSCAQRKSSKDALEEKHKTKLVLERRVVSFPLEEQQDSKSDLSSSQQQQQNIQRISKAETIERFIAALERDGEVIVENSGDIDMKFEAID